MFESVWVGCTMLHVFVQDWEIYHVGIFFSEKCTYGFCWFWNGKTKHVKRSFDFPWKIGYVLCPFTQLLNGFQILAIRNLFLVFTNPIIFQNIKLRMDLMLNRLCDILYQFTFETIHLRTYNALYRFID